MYHSVRGRPTRSFVETSRKKGQKKQTGALFTGRFNTIIITRIILFLPPPPPHTVQGEGGGRLSKTK